MLRGINISIILLSYLNPVSAQQQMGGLRGEYFNDESGVIISTGTLNGFKTFGVSLNVDRTFGKHLLWRTEFRTFGSKDAIFTKDSTPKKNNSAITTSLALTF